MPNFGCQSEPPQALRRFGLVMMRAWMNRISSFCNLKMVSNLLRCPTLGVRANLLKPCQSKAPHSLRWFGMVMMTAWMHEQSPCCHCMVLSIGSDAQLRVSEVSEQTSSSREEVWIGYDEVKTILGNERVRTRPSMLSSWTNLTF